MWVTKKYFNCTKKRVSNLNQWEGLTCHRFERSNWTDCVIIYVRLSSKYILKSHWLSHSLHNCVPWHQHWYWFTYKLKWHMCTCNHLEWLLTFALLYLKKSSKSQRIFSSFLGKLYWQESMRSFYLWVTIWSRSFENKKNNLEVPLTVASWMLQEKSVFLNSYVSKDCTDDKLHKT